MADEKPEEGWVQHQAVTGRPQDTPLPNSTFADRAKARAKTSKAVAEDGAENKAVAPKKSTKK